MKHPQPLQADSDDFAGTSASRMARVGSGGGGGGHATGNGAPGGKSAPGPGQPQAGKQASPAAASGSASKRHRSGPPSESPSKSRRAAADSESGPDIGSGMHHPTMASPRHASGQHRRRRGRHYESPGTGMSDLGSSGSSASSQDDLSGSDSEDDDFRMNSSDRLGDNIGSSEGEEGSQSDVDEGSPRRSVGTRAPTGASGGGLKRRASRKVSVPDARAALLTKQAAMQAAQLACRNKGASGKPTKATQAKADAAQRAVRKAQAAVAKAVLAESKSTARKGAKASGGGGPGGGGGGGSGAASAAQATVKGGKAPGGRFRGGNSIGAFPYPGSALQMRGLPARREEAHVDDPEPGEGDLPGAEVTKQAGKL